MFACVGERSKLNGTISVFLLLLFLFLWTSPCSTAEPLKDKIFPKIQVTLYNELENPVLYMCGMNNSEAGLLVLGPKNQTSFYFAQLGFPLRWCYIYINDQKNGFFWAYAVRQKCSKCFWRVADHLYLYRSDRNRWERQSMYSPRIQLKKLGKKE